MTDAQVVPDLQWVHPRRRTGRRRSRGLTDTLGVCLDGQRRGKGAAVSAVGNSVGRLMRVHACEFSAVLSTAFSVGTNAAPTPEGEADTIW